MELYWMLGPHFVQTYLKKNIFMDSYCYYFATGDCGLKYPEGFVVGGEEARPGEFPYMALLVKDIIYGDSTRKLLR